MGLTYVLNVYLKPWFLAYFFFLRPYNPSRTLRSSSDLLLTVPKTSHRTTGDRSFSYSAPKLWNNLPVEIRRMKELSKFKSAIKGHLFNEAYNQ